MWAMASVHVLFWIYNYVLQQINSSLTDVRSENDAAEECSAGL